MDNVLAGQQTFRRFEQELKDEGFAVNGHSIDPATGNVYMSVTFDGHDVRSAIASGVFTRMAKENISVGLGVGLRTRLWEGVNSGAIKLMELALRRK